MQIFSSRVSFLSKLTQSLIVLFFTISIHTAQASAPLIDIHVESNNAVDSGYAIPGDAVTITYTIDPASIVGGAVLTTFDTLMIAFDSTDNWTQNGNWDYGRSFDSCLNIISEPFVCTYTFIVPETGDMSAPFVPAAGPLDFGIYFYYMADDQEYIIPGSTDGSSVIIDRTAAPSVTVASPSNDSYVGNMFTVSGTCTNGLPVNFSGTGFTPTTASTSCTGGTYTSPTFTTVSNINIDVSQATTYGITTTVSRHYLAPAPTYDSTKTWDFSTPSQYTYDSSKITVSSGTAQFQKTVSEKNYWIKSADNPFLVPTQPWEGDLVFEPSVIYEGGVFKMWYSGGNACYTGYATSPDGITWTKPYTNPIVGSGNGGINGSACRNNVIKHNGVYYMTVVTGAGNGGEVVVLLTSTNGTDFSNPVTIMRPESWNIGIANTNVFIDDDGTWYLLYDAQSSIGSQWEMGIASGPDLQHLTNYPGNPLRTLKQGGIYGGAVLHKIGNTYHTWYHLSTNNMNTPTEIYHSISDDLHTWHNLPGVVVEISQPSWEVDQTADPFIVEANGKTYMFYDGDDNSVGVIARIGMVEFDGTLEDLVGTWEPSITPLISTAQPFDSLWGFTETATKGSNTEIYYQVSIDGGTTWKYWNGSAWVTAGAFQRSTGAEIGDNIRTLTNSAGTFMYKAFLYSEGNAVSLDSVALSYSYTSAPTALTVTTTTSDASLSWTAPSESTAPITDYLIEYKQSSSGTWNTFAHTASTLTTATITGLTAGTSYDFRVSAVTSEGTSDASSVVTVSTSSPSTGGGGGGFVLLQHAQNYPGKTVLPVSQAPQTQTPTVCTPYITGSIKQGSVNDPALIRKLQEFLNTYEKTNLTIDGTYDADDILAVKKFQEKYQSEILAPWGLVQGTGTVSITTLAKINALHCGQTTSCPYFTGYIKAGESGPEVSKVKSFLNMIDATLKLDTSSQIADTSFIAAVSKFQLRYKDFILKPWGLSRPTGYWYKTTSAKANEFMGCVK